MVDKEDECVDLEKIIKNYDFFQFPIEIFFESLEENCRKLFSKAVEAILDDFNKDSILDDNEVENYSIKANENLNMLFQLRKLELRNHFVVTQMFDVKDHVTLSDNDSVNDYSEEKDREIDEKICEMYKKLKICHILRSKIQEVDHLITQLNEQLPENT